MKRKQMYIGVAILLIACVIGVCAYRIAMDRQSGFTGSKIFHFGKNSDVSGEKETPATEDNGKEETTSEETKDVPEEQEKTDVSEKQDNKYPEITTKGKVRQYKQTGVVVAGNAAFEMYSYVDNVAGRYTKAVNNLTKTLDSGVDVYDMIIPTSVGITFPDNKKGKSASSSQSKALHKIETKLSGREKFVPLYDIMMQHRDEYEYFRTDHHWTALGAYYAYTAFCEQKGLQATEISAYKKKNFGKFLGTFYNETNENKSLKADTVDAYYPQSKNVKVTYEDVNGKKYKGSVITNASDYGVSMKYLAFINGDQPFMTIQNKDKHDGTSCIVVKESFGNAFVPFLVDHYETIYVIDYRYWQGKLSQFVKKKRAKEVILINNISMTRNAYLIGRFTQAVS